MKFRIYSFLIFLIIIQIITNDQTKCEEDYQKILNMSDPQSFEILFFATGRNLPIDPGDYDMCNSLENTHQCVFQFIIEALGTEMQLEWGLCLPKSCNNEFAPFALDLYLNEFFPFGKRDPSTTVTNCADELTKKITAGTVITSIVSLLFILFVIVASFRFYFVQLHDKKILKNQLNIQSDFHHDQIDSQNLSENSSWIQSDNVDNDDNFSLSEKKVKKQSRFSKYLWKFLYCYTFQTNFRKLIQKSPIENTKFLNGIRVISMFWIIFGHSIFFELYPGFNNDLTLFSPKGPPKKWPFQILNGGELGVDTFFFLSGFLISFLSIPKVQSKKLNIGIFYFHRIWRLMPSLAFVILIYMNISPFFGNGPFFWQYTEVIKETCSKYWYSSLLFFNNFYPSDNSKECIPWVWYLANDVQFHVITPIFLYLFSWKKIFGLISVFSMICLGCGMNFWLTHKYNINFYLFDDSMPDYMKYIYVRPYTRILPYIVGVGCAMLLIWATERKRKANDFDEKMNLINTRVTQTKSKTKSLIFAHLLFVVFFAILLIVVFLPYNNYKDEGKKWNINANAAYIGLSKLFWGIGMAGIVVIFIKYSNVFSLIKKFLSWDLWTPLARLTYNAYLMHPIIMYLANLSSRILFNYNAVPIFYATTTNVILAYVFSFIIFLLVERPFMNFEKILCAKFIGSG
ncbi:o-acyltransferase [Anaeramoeba ignava]|uniref:O-acyltransferase n=1 Tax=Anaeramoeba ignava TaxID=1746090 RepID=A0A9Q0LNW7_ANAIG|nr:o-acyltransferase [Anaeramoeba ignava]